MAWLRASLRAASLLVWLLLGGLLALVLLNVNEQRAYRPRELRLVRFWCAGMLRVLGVHMMVHGAAVGGCVRVANHMSWLDIVVLMSVAPCRFLSKAEVAQWPLIGWLAQRAGTVFLRRGQGETSEAMQQLGVLAQLGDAVLFFPEGTTTDHAPKAFHARLFALPIALNVPIQPVSVFYQDATGSRCDIAYVGEQSFIANLWYLLKQKQLSADVQFLPVIEPEGQLRKALAEQTHRQISMAWLAQKQRCFLPELS